MVSTDLILYPILFKDILSFGRVALSTGVINCGMVIPPETMISASATTQTLHHWITKIQMIQESQRAENIKWQSSSSLSVR